MVQVDQKENLESDKTLLEDIVKAYIAKDVDKLKLFIKQGYCKIENKKLVLDKKILENQKKIFDFWDQMQYIRKILLNSLYGALLNPFCRFFDSRLGQSTTLTGRNITKHMSAKINEIITGDYDNLGKAVVYGDSVTGDTIVNTSLGKLSIEALFQYCKIKWSDRGKDFSTDETVLVESFDVNNNQQIMLAINYVVEHETDKCLYEIIAEDGNTIQITEDHSIMVERKGEIIEVKPTDIEEDDFLIVSKTNLVERVKIKSVNKLIKTKNKVYDISIKSDDESQHLFFGNNILCHNTDSISPDSNIKTSIGTFTIEELFEKSRIKWQKDEKEYAVDDNFKVAGYSNAKPEFEKFNYIYRHKVNKKRFKIVDSLNNEVIVTEDHSIMVLDDNNNLIERKPNDLKNGDRIISLKE